MRRWCKLADTIREARRRETALLVRALEDTSAATIQHGYRQYVARWTRPRVSALHSRIRDLEQKLQTTSGALDTAVRRLANAQRNRQRRTILCDDAATDSA
jgi:hypothetical protein